MKRPYLISIFFFLLLCLLSQSRGEVSAVSKVSKSPYMIKSMETVLGPEILVSTITTPEADRYLPAVAYNNNHDEYLIVWHNTWPDGRRDIYARRVDANGDLLSWFSVATGIKSKFQPAVAYNSTNDEYLVVWMFDVNGDGSAYEIWGRTIGWNGAYLNPEFQIITWPNRSFWTPRVAWNSLQNEYMVIWNAMDTTTSLPVDVSSMLLDANGDVITGRILTTSSYPQQADIIYNPVTNEYFVVFVRSYTQATTGNDVYGLRVNAANSVIDPPGAILISNDPGDENHPAIASNGKFSYAVVWETLKASDYDIYGKKLDFNGNDSWGISYLIAITLNDETLPSITSDGIGYLTTWQTTETNGTSLNAVYWDSPNNASFEVSPAGFWDNENGAVAAGNHNFLITYEGDSTGDPTIYRHIYARLWTINQQVFIPIILKD
ncbi:MAG: hypothetical protein CL609_14970 [Anaerolineaceae bacterium]|nr:hypothetical protein [Anaerolineaceae bacterium]